MTHIAFHKIGEESGTREQVFQILYSEAISQTRVEKMERML